MKDWIEGLLNIQSDQYSFLSPVHGLFYVVDDAWDKVVSRFSGEDPKELSWHRAIWNSGVRNPFRHKPLEIFSKGGKQCDGSLAIDGT